MHQRLIPTVMLMAAAVIAAPLQAADDAMGRDLKATIALQGNSCDQIVSSQRNADSDYTATCKDGNRYHIYVNPQGRVVVDKL